MARKNNHRREKNSDQHLAELAEIAALYYEDKKNQDEIARMVGRSSSMISRLLSEAQERGLIEVRIRHPIRSVPKLQQALTERFDLDVARVLASAHLSDRQMVQGLGRLSARFLQTLVRDDWHIAISWGTTLYEVIQSLQPDSHYQNIEVIQVSGSAGSREPLTDGVEVANLLATKLNGTASYLPVPMIVDEPMTRQYLLSDSAVAPLLEKAKQADLLLLGIGTPDPETSGLLRAGYVSADELLQIQQEGGVGDIFANFFNIQGQRCGLQLSERHVGLDLEDLNTMSKVMAVAGGKHKAAAILGALRRQCIDYLVTDEKTAHEILRLEERVLTIRN